jgi:hypothetical protein
MTMSMLEDNQLLKMCVDIEKTRVSKHIMHYY